MAPNVFYKFGISLLLGGLCLFGKPMQGRADDCLFRDDAQIKTEKLVAARDYAKALAAAQALHAAYDACQKSDKTDADLRTMNRAWRADAAVMIGGIYRATGRKADADGAIKAACRDYAVVLNATDIDTTTRKLANAAIGKNCKR